ncbi:MAG: MmcQ/YjbR family DNA-binding protein [Clostridia bacterium]|nr:MmcQ/YjbR family DNA-binding protein [Clostridia bacterium]
MVDRVKTIFEYAKERFGTDLEYLWKNDANSAVLRNKINRKWYAIVMKVKRDSLCLEGIGSVWIMNVKCDPMMVGSFINRKGFLPAYHMNKEHWMSIVIDDSSVAMEEILNILEMSYEIVDKAKKSKGKNRTD